uniref:Uncharacterized protein n=1 Tax=Entomoneis paludosa TaxID=265537 RepID=A0A7S2Y812_9STRA|mmetsp:Transcript_21540/g.44931  ORF Transcript_21540/g.44931 Transcript_21540/m.44931 type:complete len:575 (+) Transcript_21540:98-1822(+)
MKKAAMEVYSIWFLVWLSALKAKSALALTESRQLSSKKSASTYWNSYPNENYVGKGVFGMHHSSSKKNPPISHVSMPWRPAPTGMSKKSGPVLFSMDYYAGKGKKEQPSKGYYATKRPSPPPTTSPIRVVQAAQEPTPTTSDSSNDTSNPDNSNPDANNQDPENQPSEEPSQLPTNSPVSANNQQSVPTAVNGQQAVPTAPTVSNPADVQPNNAPISLPGSPAASPYASPVVGLTRRPTAPNAMEDTAPAQAPQDSPSSNQDKDGGLVEEEKVQIQEFTILYQLGENEYPKWPHFDEAARVSMEHLGEFFENRNDDFIRLESTIHKTTTSPVTISWQLTMVFSLGSTKELQVNRIAVEAFSFPGVGPLMHSFSQLPQENPFSRVKFIGFLKDGSRTSGASSSSSGGFGLPTGLLVAIVTIMIFAFALLLAILLRRRRQYRHVRDRPRSVASGSIASRSVASRSMASRDRSGKQLSSKPGDQSRSTISSGQSESWSSSSGEQEHADDQFHEEDGNSTVESESSGDDDDKEGGPDFRLSQGRGASSTAAQIDDMLYGDESSSEEELRANEGRHLLA